METLITKSDVDRVFSLNKAQWAETAALMIAPGWTLHITDHHTGAHIIGFSPDKGVGLSIQPFFRDEKRPPDMVVVGNYFPLGLLPPMTEQLKREMEALVQKEISSAYSLNLKHEIQDKMEMIEIVITEP